MTSTERRRRVPSSRGRRPGVRAVRDAVHPAAGARPVLLPALPDGVEPRARRGGRRSRRGDRLVGHRDDGGGRAACHRGAWDLHRVAAAVGETVWWVTLVDATLVRYHPRDYQKALADKDVRRRKTEGTLEGLRYVRNQLGKSVEPDEFVGDDGAGGWAWRPLPEPALEALAPRARQWELSRYHAYQERLAGREIARTFARCTEFLAQAAALVSSGS